MQINRNKLKEALEIVKPGLANKELIEQSTSFAFMGDRVVTYNDEISISHRIKGLDLTGAIKADRLYALLGKIKKDEIEIEAKGNEVQIRAGRSHAGFTLQREIKLPLEEEIIQKGKWKELPAKFLDFMGLAVSSCGKELAKAILMCVHVNEKGFIEGSDDRRITRCDLGESMPVKTFLIPASAVLDMLRIKPTKIAEGEGSWMHFHNPMGTIISCRLFDDKYPNCSSILRMEGAELVLPHSIKEVLERANVFAKRDHLLDEELFVTIQNGRIRIEAEADSGWFREETKIEYNHAPISFQIVPYLLKGILSDKNQSCEISKGKIKFEGKGWVYVSLLRQVKE